jgi:hypothetical protein
LTFDGRKGGKVRDEERSGFDEFALLDENFDNLRDCGVSFLFALSSGTESPREEVGFEFVDGGEDDCEIVVCRGERDEFQEDGETELVQRTSGGGERVEEGSESCVSSREGRVRGAVTRERNGIGEGKNVRGEIRVFGGEEGEDERENEVGEAFEFLVGRLESRLLDAREQICDYFPFRFPNLFRFFYLLDLFFRLLFLLL